jgi:hypothetical protein
MAVRSSAQPRCRICLANLYIFVERRLLNHLPALLSHHGYLRASGRGWHEAVPVRLIYDCSPEGPRRVLAVAHHWLDVSHPGPLEIGARCARSSPSFVIQDQRASWSSSATSCYT